MSFNLVDAVKNFIPGELVDKAGTFLGESETGVRKALSGIIPAVLGGLVDKSSTSAGADSVFHMASEQSHSNIDPAGFLGSDDTSLLSKGADLLGGIFGDKASGLAGILSNFAGIRSGSASSLLSIIAPVVLGFLGKHASSNNLTAGGLGSLLSSQKENISNAIPAGLNLSGIINSAIPAVSAAQQTTAPVSHHEAEATEEAGNGLKWLLPILLLVLLAAAAWYLFGTKVTKSAEPEVATTTTTTTTTTEAAKPAADTTAKIATTTRESLKVKLPDGTELDAFKGGIEDKLVAFLNTDYKKLGADSLKNIWFDFDNLNFKTASAEITPESQKQIDNLAAILKAFPVAKLKIGGYTDKVGDEAANKKLSGARATSVKTALDKAGRGTQIAGAEGYGSDFAKFPATAPESDRLTDRHVSVSVRL